MKNNSSFKNYPFVSICTPTFNRRPFFPIIIKCFENQNYPKERMEWIIIDDGTDKIEDIVIDIPQVKYYKYNEKMTLGKKRNLMHEKCSGDIIIYMDDDDYYPPERVSHAVETLQNNPQALCAGSSEMYIYFKHIHKMYQFGPYNKNHSTAATFAFKRSLLNETSYDESQCLREEKHFLKNYTIPFIQLNPLKTILVFSHVHNSFDKKMLLINPDNKYIKESNKLIEDFIKEKDIKKFFMEDIDILLSNYEPGKPENKPDVLQQFNEIKESREKKIEEHKNLIKIRDTQNIMNNNSIVLEQSIQINSLLRENNALKEKINYLENKIKDIISKSIQEKTENSKKQYKEIA